jgi:hypothetical protein
VSESLSSNKLSFDALFREYRNNFNIAAAGNCIKCEYSLADSLDAFHEKEPESTPSFNPTWGKYNE